MITEEQKEKDRDLEGREIAFVADLHGESDLVLEAIVTGLDYDVGITVQEVSTKNYLMCIQGPASPFATKSGGEKYYDVLYSTVIKAIRAGKVIASKIQSISLIHGRRVGEGASAKTCPFSQ